MLERRAVRHWRLAFGALFGRGAGRDIARFAAIQRRLFAAARDVSGAKTVIDSSKAAPRAWALSGVDEATILHLRRNPKDVIASWRRSKADPSLGGAMKRPPALLAATEWLKVELSAARLATRRPVDRLSYETFIEAPEAAIASRPALPQNVAWTGTRRFAPDPDYHALNGNPDRFSRGEIHIQPPQAADIPHRERRAAAALGAALDRIAP